MGRLAAGGISIAAAHPLRALKPLPDSDADRLLHETKRRACLYFYEMADPNTGLVLDRGGVNASYAPGVASIAATGFGLSALAIAHSRGYVDPSQAHARVRSTLRFLCERADHQRGFFYHFLDSASGRRVWNSEASSIDTGWLLCGVLHSKAYWDDAEILVLANQLLDRADWGWMLDHSQTLSHGWKPETGFLTFRWDSYSEMLAMYLLAIASLTHPIPASCWNSWKRPLRECQGMFYIDAHTPLFVHQYSHAWFDFRDRADRYANYFRNSVRATQAHRLYCIDLAPQFPWYGPDMWGVTASDSPGGYRVWCSPENPPDGTLVPCAAGGSLAFLPQACTAVLANMLDRFGSRVWSKYGFVDAFHPREDWYSRDVIGIDLGIMLLMAENTTSGSVWASIMSTSEAQRGIKVAGLRRYA